MGALINARNVLNLLIIDYKDAVYPETEVTPEEELLKQQIKGKI